MYMVWTFSTPWPSSQLPISQLQITSCARALGQVDQVGRVVHVAVGYQDEVGLDGVSPASAPSGCWAQKMDRG